MTSISTKIFLLRQKIISAFDLPNNFFLSNLTHFHSLKFVSSNWYYTHNRVAYCTMLNNSSINVLEKLLHSSGIHGWVLNLVHFRRKCYFHWIPYLCNFLVWKLNKVIFFCLYIYIYIVSRERLKRVDGVINYNERL